MSSYASHEAGGVLAIVIAGSLSIDAIVVALLTGVTRILARNDTHFQPYYVSLLLANFLQSLGSVMSAKWILQGFVLPGMFCSFQGALKHAGNIATALWAFMIASHAFHLLFLRWKSSKTLLYMTLFFGWASVVLIVTIGPTVIEPVAKRGPYFGKSGLWCWITPEYPREQFFLEYFFEFVSAGVGFFLYSAILLRVRGNLVKSGGRWHMRYVPREESWRLGITRDLIDSSMLRVVALMVWYPVAYSLIILPIALVRVTEFATRVPAWVTIICDVVFNLNGLINVLLLWTTRRLLPDKTSIPSFATPRKAVDLSSPEAAGLTPFVLLAPSRAETKDATAIEDSGIAEAWSVQRRRTAVLAYPDLALARTRTNSSKTSITSSADSQTCLPWWEVIEVDGQRSR